MATEKMRPARTEAYQAANAYVKAGISLIPIGRDGEKQPDFPRLPQVREGGKMKGVWRFFKERLPTDDELQAWFNIPEPSGIGILGGAISGRLECLDFDLQAEKWYPIWRELVEDHWPGLLAKLTVIKSPNGYHVWFRCSGRQPTTKTLLAADPAEAEDDWTICESRGEASYTLAPGTPVECHELRKPWALLSGPKLSQVADISPEEHEVLWAAAQALDLRPPKVKRPSKAKGDRSITPIDDYLQRGPTIPSMLPEGWELVGSSGRVQKYRRPLKNEGSASATLGFLTDRFGGPMWYPFTTNCHPFAQGRFHDKFQVYQDVFFGGNFDAAMSQIVKDHYGTPLEPKKEKEKDDKPPRLIDVLLKQGHELFCTPKEECYLALRANGRAQMYEIGEKKFGDYCADVYWKATRQSCTEQAINESARILRCMAREEGAVQPVHMRRASHNGKIYVDLATKEGECIEIDAASWRIVDVAPVRFFRNSSTIALPRPEHGGALDEFRAQLNLDGEMSWLLLAAFMGYCWFGESDFPVLLMTGESGSSKSTTSDLLKELVDPSNAAGLPVPEKEEDYLHNANVGLLFWLDNISSINQMQSDSFCRLSTGAAFLKRLHYSNSEVSTTRISRPVVITTITDIVNAPDLMNRCIEVRCKAFGIVKRLLKARVKERFALTLPRLLGALADAVSKAMRELPNIPEENLPRLADFSFFGEAFWRGQGAEPGMFMAFMMQAQRAANASMIENSPLAEVLIPWFEENGNYIGTMLDLWRKLNAIAPQATREQKAWPKGAQRLARVLATLEPNLREHGILISKGVEDGRNASKFLHLIRKE